MLHPNSSALMQRLLDVRLSCKPATCEKNILLDDGEVL